MSGKPTRSLIDRIAAVLSPLAVITRVIYDLFMLTHFGIQH